MEEIVEGLKLLKYKQGFCPICNEPVTNPDYVLCEQCVHQVKKSALYTMDEPTIGRELSRISQLVNGTDDERLSKEFSLHYFKLLESTGKDKDDLAKMLTTTVVYVLRNIQGKVAEDDEYFACIVDYFGELFGKNQPEDLIASLPKERDELEAEVEDVFERLSIRDTISLVTLTCGCVSLAYEYDYNYEAYDLLIHTLKSSF